MLTARLLVCDFDTDWRVRFAEVCTAHGLCVADEPPADVAVLQVDTGADIARALADLGARPGLQHLPTIIAGGPDEPASYRAAAAAGAQTYVPGLDPERIAAAVAMVLDTVHVFAAVNPLTGLPGSPALEREIAARLPDRGNLAVVQFDLDNFKPYNDVYGYQQGDRMILWLKDLIQDAVARHQPAHWFIAHLGGDDFFLTTTVPSAKILGAEVVDAFEAGRVRLFTAQHQQDGHFHARNRAGEENIFPLTTLTAVVVTNEADDITHPGHIAAVLAELKTHAKTMDGSNFVCDRRSHHWTAQDGPDSSAIPEGKGFGDAGKK